MKHRLLTLVTAGALLIAGTTIGAQNQVSVLPVQGAVSLITIGGTGARKPTAQFTIGSSVNAAAAAFTKCLADRGKTDGVQVNCIHPSVVETDRTRRRIKAEIERTGKPEKEVRAEILHEFNTIRFGTIEDVGNLVTFIVSSRASWLQGATIDLDGGEIPVL